MNLGACRSPQYWEAPATHCSTCTPVYRCLLRTATLPSRVWQGGSLFNVVPQDVPCIQLNGLWCLPFSLALGGASHTLKQAHIGLSMPAANSYTAIQGLAGRRFSLNVIPQDVPCTHLNGPRCLPFSLYTGGASHTLQHRSTSLSVPATNSYTATRVGRGGSLVRRHTTRTPPVPISMGLGACRSSQ